MNIKDFIDKEYREFAVYNCVRTIPSIKDGLKLPQRKALFGVLDLNQKAKVSTATSHIIKVSGYLHGESSMEDTVVRMAQKYPGANNIPLFEGDGQFGSRLSPEAAASRYIHVSPSNRIWEMFSKQDNEILEHRFEEGSFIEPDSYFPVVPVCLVNGASGIGSGFATDIMAHRYSDLKKAIKEVLSKGKVKTPLVPSYEGFKGTTEKLENGQVLIKGTFKRVNTTTIEITELPIGYHNDSYKEVLNRLIDDKFIKDYDNLSTEDEWKFIVYVPRTTTALTDDELMVKFKLISRNTQNIVLWDTNDNLKIYDSVESVLEEFVDWRLGKYELLRNKLIDKSNDQVSELQEKMKFIKAWIDAPNEFSNKPKAVIHQKMVDRGVSVELVEKFMRIPVYSFTDEEITSLRDKISELKNYVVELQNTTANEMYLKAL